MIQKSSLPTAANVPQPREVVMPDFTSNTYAPFSFIIGGDIQLLANQGVLWAPVQTRFVLRGGYILVTCRAVCNAATPVLGAHLFLFDEGPSNPIMSVGIYNSGTTAPGDIVSGTWPFANAAARLTALPFQFDLGRGYKSKAIGNRVTIGGSSIGTTGQFQVSGVLWGIQET